MEGSEQAVGQAKQTKEERKAPYTVLTPMDVEIPMAEGQGMRRLQVWREVATVDLPFRSQRRSAVLPALEQAEEDGKPGQAFLVLDEDTAAPMRLQERPAPPVAQRFEVVSG